MPAWRANRGRDGRSKLYGPPMDPEAESGAELLRQVDEVLRHDVDPVVRLALLLAVRTPLSRAPDERRLHPLALRGVQVAQVGGAHHDLVHREAQEIAGRLIHGRIGLELP